MVRYQKAYHCCVCAARVSSRPSGVSNLRKASRFSSLLKALVVRHTFNAGDTHFCFKMIDLQDVQNIIVALLLDIGSECIR